MKTQSLSWSLDAIVFPRFRKLSINIQVIMAITVLVVCAPFLLIVALGIKCTSSGPVIFTQTRIGKNGVYFKFYKFRSMYLKSDPKYVEPGESDRDGLCKKYRQDPRITPLGRIIRKLSIDELPQLINVIKGDMALVGPRPALPSEYNEYKNKMLDRLDVLPGITGLWQVSGRADTTFEHQIELDLNYVKQHSLWMDLKILLLTIPAVIFCRGAY
ncbi:sugar transferase [Marinibactrum halimedae]|uniref:Multidrug MFS transporter n=1 Tax=Marinibactrum halimedae TaxID=1444977 RepID=A0AA37T7M4_9GAMM|nr:sugar transferase [Marinibactrum halimedae]MCD9457836.1 sugar transferase [Marinibactrum halimedae]GLS24790.1 multidrug MFS transporter [Marinibactrum halimedae]